MSQIRHPYHVPAHMLDIVYLSLDEFRIVKTYVFPFPISNFSFPISHFLCPISANLQFPCHKSWKIYMPHWFGIGFLWIFIALLCICIDVHRFFICLNWVYSFFMAIAWVSFFHILFICITLSLHNKTLFHFFSDLITFSFVVSQFSQLNISCFRGNAEQEWELGNRFPGFRHIQRRITFENWKNNWRFWM